MWVSLGGQEATPSSSAPWAPVNLVALSPGSLGLVHPGTVFYHGHLSVFPESNRSLDFASRSILLFYVILCMSSIHILLQRLFKK